MEDTQKYFLLHSSKPLHYCKITNTKTFTQPTPPLPSLKKFLRHCSIHITIAFTPPAVFQEIDLEDNWCVHVHSSPPRGVTTERILNMWLYCDPF